MIWDEMTYEELGQVDKTTPVLQPVAATEQHGPHLPLATDRHIGEYFCYQLHKSIPDKVLILPSIAVGCSEHHLDYPGSLSVPHETLLGQVSAIFDAVRKHGFTNIVLFNSHGGNQAIGQVFVEKYGYRHQDVNVYMITWWKLIQEGLLKITTTGFGGTGHAGEFETSLMMLIRPELIRKEKVVAGYPKPASDWTKQDMLKAPVVSKFKTFRQMTKKGTFGDPTKASVEKGIKISQLVIHECENFLNSI